MNIATAKTVPGVRTDGLIDRFQEVRKASEDLCKTLAVEDMVVQSMPDASPIKWHLAHITWFFENFILVPHAPGYKVFNPEFGFLFNSYYYSVGSMYERPKRGMVTRPTVNEVFDYRASVTEAVLRFLDETDREDIPFLVELGLHHEQQHQELMLTDVKHLLFQNPLFPSFRKAVKENGDPPASLEWNHQDEQIAEIGFQGNTFCFDNETPRHRALVPAHRIANRLITNGEYLQFVKDGGYDNCDVWLSDGWAKIKADGWIKPMYWHEDLAQEFTLSGLQDINLHAPVTHLSYYEADAFARWAGYRLPTEFEWEVFASQQPIQGNFVESGLFHPTPRQDEQDTQVFGDVWEWTMSAYTAYPGFEPLAGSLGEYNGKFMSGQMVLRGGSCATPQNHIRASYRNFFYPDARWQFSGIRLASNV